MPEGTASRPQSTADVGASADSRGIVQVYSDMRAAAMRLSSYEGALEAPWSQTSAIMGRLVSALETNAPRTTFREVVVALKDVLPAAFGGIAQPGIAKDLDDIGKGLHRAINIAKIDNDLVAPLYAAYLGIDYASKAVQRMSEARTVPLVSRAKEEALAKQAISAAMDFIGIATRIPGAPAVPSSRTIARL